MYIDAHTHLDKYGDGLGSALEEIEKWGIVTISSSMDIPSYERNLEIARQSRFVVPTFGVHPWCAGAYAERLADLDKAIEQSPMLAEIGLDYFFVEDTSRYQSQQMVLEYFLAAAAKERKSVVLHTKGAETEVLELLSRYGIERAIVHWYSGSLDVLQDYVRFGAYFTVGVEVLYSEHVQALARNVPFELLLTETDNPGGAEWLTGTPGKPSLIIDVVQKLAEIRAVTPKELCQKVRRNFLRLMKADPHLTEVRALLGDEHLD